MATYTAIPNTDIETDKPIRAVTGRALRDNPIAIAEGASGAPRVQVAAFAEEQRMNTTNVLAQVGGAISGAVGTFALARRRTTGPLINFNETVSGSNLEPSNSSGGGDTISLSGTWRVAGSFLSTTQSPVCFRIS